MNVKRWGWKGLGMSLGVVLMAAGATYAILTVSGVSLEESGSAHRGDGLAICVQEVGVESSVQSIAKTNIDLAMVQVAKHPKWSEAGLDKAPSPVVETGCEAEPQIYHKSYGELPKSFFDVIGRRVDTPSQHGIFVFVLPDEEITRLSGGLSIRTSAEEVQCFGDACGEVTTGLYIGVSELTDSAFLAEQLEYAIGLDPPY
jgi:hypothetical protein